LTYEVEQYSKDDPLRFVAVCLNDALAMAKGDFVVDMNDDDYVDETYAEKMVALFQGDTACIAASGGINRVGAKGEYRGNYDFYNARPTYTPGILVTFSNFLAGNTKEFHRFLYGAYGLTFSYRRDVLQKVGGFHRDTDNSIMFGYLPFGTVGSDPSARFNWRVHDEQLSKRMGEGGHVGLQYSADFWRARAPARRWELFGAEVATRFDARMRSYIATLALSAGLTGGPGVHGSMEKLRDAVLAFGPELENSPALLDFDKATGRI
jgi:hypothetical protein